MRHAVAAMMVAADCLSRFACTAAADAADVLAGAWSEPVNGVRGAVWVIESVTAIGDDLVLLVGLQNVAHQPVRLPWPQPETDAHLTNVEVREQTESRLIQGVNLRVTLRATGDASLTATEPFLKQELVELLQPAELELAPGQIHLLALRISSGPQPQLDLLQHHQPQRLTTHRLDLPELSAMRGTWEVNLLY